MTNDEPSNVGPRGKRFGPGEGPQLLADMQNTGAEVVGSDGETIGDLKAVRDADFVVKRSLVRRDLHVPVKAIQEVTTDNRIVIDIPADQVDEMDWEKSWSEPSGGAEADRDDFAEGSKREKGIWGMTKEE